MYIGRERVKPFPTRKLTVLQNKMSKIEPSWKDTLSPRKHRVCITPWKFNIAPEKIPSQKERQKSSNHVFSVENSLLNFGRVLHITYEFHLHNLHLLLEPPKSWSVYTYIYIMAFHQAKCILFLFVCWGKLLKASYVSWEMARYRRVRSLDILDA